MRDRLIAPPPPTVLLVEDDTVTSLAMTGQLNLLGYQVCAKSKNGEEAVRLARELTPDLVLMDIYLEGAMDGIEAAQIIRAELGLPVIFLTAHAEHETLQRVKAVDPLAFLLKPIHQRDLHAAIELALYKHQMELRLQHSETKYRLLFENAAAGIYQCDREGNFLTANTSFALMLGYETPEDLLANARKVTAQYYVAPERFDELRARLAQGGEVENFEAEVYGKDGNVLWVSESARAVREQREDAGGERDEGGVELSYYQVVALDITDRKEAEEAYRLTHSLLERTMDAIPALVSVVDLSGHVIQVNQAFERRLGRKAEELLGEKVQELLYGASSPPEGDPLAGMARSGAREQGVVSLGNGQGYFVAASPFRGIQGEMIGAVYMAWDLAELKPLFRTLEGSRDTEGFAG